MEQTSQILHNYLKRSQTGLTQGRSLNALSEIPLLLTPAQVDKLHYSFPEPVPTPKPCQFCGKILLPLGRRSFFKSVILGWERFEECQCETAREKRENERKEQELRQKQEEEALRRAEYKTKVDRLFKESRIGERFKKRTFENFQVTRQNQTAFAMAKKYADNFQRYKEEGLGLIFNGWCGTGKTHLAAAIAIQLLNQGIPVVFGTTITLLGKLKESYGREIKESERSIIELYSTVDLLVLDDFGKERPGEWTLEKLYLIINSRYENNLPIIITTNYSIEALTNRLAIAENKETGGAITSRLWEICRGIQMDYDDWRKSA